MKKVWRCKKNPKHEKLNLERRRCKRCNGSLQILCLCNKCKQKDEKGAFISYTTYLSHNKKVKDESETFFIQESIDSIDSFLYPKLLSEEETETELLIEKSKQAKIDNFSEEVKESIGKECGYYCASCFRKKNNGKCIQIIENNFFDQSNGVWICDECYQKTDSTQKDLRKLKSEAINYYSSKKRLNDDFNNNLIAIQTNEIRKLSFKFYNEPTYLIGDFLKELDYYIWGCRYMPENSQRIYNEILLICSDIWLGKINKNGGTSIKDDISSEDLSKYIYLIQSSMKGDLYDEYELVPRGIDLLEKVIEKFKERDLKDVKNTLEIMKQSK